MIKQQQKALFIALISYLVSAGADSVVPIGTSPFYYEIGGGNDFSLPASKDTTTIHLQAESGLDTSKGCSVFNPAVSIENYFNGDAYKIESLTKDVVRNTTAAISQWPMYELQRTNPSLYNALSNNLLGANASLSVSTKNCSAMKREIGRGENPYQDFATVSINNHFKKQIALAASHGDTDVSEAMRKISEEGGDNGIPWVQGASSDGHKMAGGRNQPLVRVIHDTAIAGYNVSLNRNVDDASSPGSDKEYQRITAIWSTPEEAANWTVITVGDLNVSTCDDCEKSQIPGRGLRYWIDTCDNENKLGCAETIASQLKDLVKGNISVNRQNLLSVSAPGVIVNEAVIRALGTMDPTTQTIMIGKLSEEIAAGRVFDEAILARRLLITGSQVPVIAANKPAQAEIHKAIKALDDDLQSMSFEHQVRKEMTSNTASAIIQYYHAQNAVAARTPVNSSGPMPQMQGGAVLQQREAT